MSERLRRSLRALIWPAMRLLIWGAMATAVFIALSKGQDPLTVLALLGCTASAAEPIARWVQSATTVRVPQVGTSSPETAS
ncbi:hypothetical protein SK854_30015 [Lentzea sp. BCCO 10_0061]|uniref:Uncharacterized protein n=1 Tax=Lentzea sokolovensis TaxID=3095429 RepID=A0ABU4V3K5_9PSEU|nr:hypothetical protein [Lentzea sp. BCCO 10_0061]MDX8146383.1 hypothetical protein [Lentzea sp. BCCO 10_0061]